MDRVDMVDVVDMQAGRPHHNWRGRTLRQLRDTPHNARWEARPGRPDGRVVYSWIMPPGVEVFYLEFRVMGWTSSTGTRGVVQTVRLVRSRLLGNRTTASA